MSRPVDNRLNRSGYGQLSETDKKPLGGQDDLSHGDALGAAPSEQSRGHEHANPDTPDHVHPALALPTDDTSSEDAR